MIGLGRVVRGAGRITVCAAALLPLSLAACATPPIQSNDTGGIIAWSPEAELAARDIAGHACGSYGKYAIITSVHRGYGDYISFECRLPGRWGPRLR